MANRNGIQRYDGTHFLDFFMGKGVLPAGVLTSMSMDTKGRLWILSGHAVAGYLDTEKLIWHPVKVTIPPAFEGTGAGMLFGKGGNILLIYVGRGFLTYNENANEIAEKYNTFSFPAGYEPRHMIQDDDLNYWAATPGGFIKYSEKKKLFSYSGHNAENDPVIAALASVKNPGVIYTDHAKRIWVTYRDPQYRVKSIDPANGEIKSWEAVVKDVSTEVWGIQSFSDGSIWMNGPGLLAKVNYDQHRIEPITSDPNSEYGIRYDLAGSLFEDREKSIWVCTNKGLYRFNPSAQFFQNSYNRVAGDTKLYVSSVTGVLETKDGEVLVSTWGEGIFSYDRNFNPIVSKYVQRKKNNEAMVWCMLQTRNGDIWRGGQEGDLFIYAAGTKKTTYLKPPECLNKTIRQLAEDQNGNIWLGTQGGRLVQWNRTDKTFRMVHQFKNHVYRLRFDNKGHLWVCTALDGVYQINSNNGSILAHYTTTGEANKKLLINDAVDIVQYDDTTMVIAANGLNILNMKSGTFTYLDEGANISNIMKDRQNHLWLSTDKGLVFRDLGKKHITVNFEARDGIKNTDFNLSAAALLSNGNIIVGSDNDYLIFNPAQALTFAQTLPEVQLARVSVMDMPFSVDSILQLGKLQVKHNENSIAFQFTTNNFQNLFSIYYKLENEDKDWKLINGDLSLNYLAPGHYTLKVTTRDMNGDTGKILSLDITVAAPFYRTWWFYSILALLAAAGFFWFDRQRIKRKESVYKMRTDIANNLHQDVNTALQNINILSEMAKIKADKDIDKSKEFIEQIHDKSRNMMIAMDDMLWSIDPANDNMQQTILRMQEFIEALNNRNNAAISMLVDDRIKKLNLSMQLRHDAFILFRESIRLVVAAGVRDAKVHITTERNMLLFMVEYATADVSNTTQLNNQLQSNEMEQRLKNIEATLRTAVGKTNTVLTISVPV